ncbi:MAG: prephenate dehydrogenase/arogenate dehydrogenase family protein [Syntrophobacteraceae bacterium]|nr:prephenate dehydrogenase/arogenate dehydrogenase family protein [Syntrophobacteraceae bacterium]
MKPREDKDSGEGAQTLGDLPPRPLPWEPPARVGIVGGLGEMGRLFTRFFQDQGYGVHVADLGTTTSALDLARSSDILLFAVPLHRTEDVVRELMPMTRSSQLIMDLSSLKVGPVREMLRSPASVVGLHPMFGGRISTYVGQTLVACPVRVDADAWGRLRQRFVGVGLRVKECTPEHHDRMMSIIQVLFHMTTMLTGRVLRELEVDIGETMDYTSPSYRLEMNILGRMFAQSPELYSAITQRNPYTGDLLDRLQAGLERYRSWVEGGDLDAFIGDFNRSADHLGKVFCERAYGESSDLLDFVVRLAARNGPSLTGGGEGGPPGNAE